MDLTPVYELRGRLRAATIAGTELIGEDYRLKRALEGMKSLEAASPVFAKISMLVKKMLAPNCPDRVGFLMEAISLTDAVLCTQGAMAVSGTLQDMECSSNAMTISNIPYSILHTLLDALQNSGQGRYSYVLNMHENRPELFEDYRVKQAMVQALGASYAELADQVAAWLKQDSKAVVPLLKDGFDKNGKKEMVRRVQIIEVLCNRHENDFYLEQIPDSEKNIRGALIWALRHSQENVNTLIDLSRTEKGNCKKMAYWALACMEGETSETFWREYVKKKPLEAIPYLKLSKTDWASEWIAKEIHSLLKEWIPKAAAGEIETKIPWKEELAQRLSVYQEALFGKAGDAICECYRQIIRVDKMLHLQLESSKSFLRAYQCCPSSDLGALAQELYETYGAEYFAAALTAKLMESTTEDCCAWVEERIWKKSLLNKKIKEDHVPYLLEALELVVWDSQLHSYVLGVTIYNPANEQAESYKTVLEHSMQGYFTDLLMKVGRTEADTIMSNWIDNEESEYCQKLIDYYYKKASVSKDTRNYARLLKRCGAKECKNLAVWHFSRKSSVSLWEIGYYFTDLPGSVEAKREEAKRLCDLMLKGGVRGVHIKEENVDVLIDNWVREVY